MESLALKRIRLFNVKGYTKLDMDLGDNKSSVLLSGDNGNGKTTLIRSIAIGLADQMGAFGLMSELSGSWVHYGQTSATIELTLISTTSEEFKLTTEIVEDEYGSIKIKKITQKRSEKNNWVIAGDDFPYYDLYCTAYGTGLRNLGKERYSQYYLTDSVYQLFKTDSKLTEQELTLRRLLDYDSPNKAIREKRKTAIFNAVNKILHLPDGWSIDLEPTGIYFVNKNLNDSDGNPEKTELTSTGDGVRATTTMLLDMMSWWHLYLEEIPKDESGYEDLCRANLITNFEKYHGIVIIDEIELHLHPSWQRQIVRNLVNTFPNVQFVFTTHSAMCVAGATDLVAKKKLKFFRISPDDTEELSLSEGSTVNDILRTKAFGISTTTSDAFEESLSQKEGELATEFRYSYGQSTNTSEEIFEQLRINNPNQQYLKNLMASQIELMKKLK